MKYDRKSCGGVLTENQSYAVLGPSTHLSRPLDAGLGVEAGGFVGVLYGVIVGFGVDEPFAELLSILELV